MSKASDFFKILRAFPDHRALFFRREYDRLGPTLRWFASRYRRTLLRRPRIVAVVGSVGKTTTTRAIAAALDCPDRKFSPSNYGASLAANLLRIRRDDHHSVLEVGIAGPGRMLSNASMIRPDVVAVTSIKSDHNRSFPTLLDTRAEKVKMVQGLSREAVVVLNGDDPNVRWMATQTQARAITFGLNADNDVRAVDVRVEGEGAVTFSIQANGATHSFESRLVGEHMVYPVLAAFAIAGVEKIDLPGALSRLAQLRAYVSRMEPIALPGGARLIDDCWKGSIESMQAAFEAVARLSATRKIVVLGNIEEPLGKVRDGYRDLGARLAGFADLVICIGGDHMTSLRRGAVKAGMDHDAIRLVGSRVDGAIQLLTTILRPGDLVLLKGSSTQKLRRITLALQQKDVRCNLKYCDMKVRCCDECPLLSAPASAFENYFVKRYLKE